MAIDTTATATGADAGKAGDAAAAAAAAGKTGDTPPAGDKTASADASAQADAAKAGDTGKGGPPEKYELKLPEGFEASDTSLSEFTPLAKELGLSNEQAQKLVDLYGGRMQSLITQQQEAWQQQVEAWRKEAKDDPEIGGAKLDAAVKNGQRVLKQFGDETLVKYLEDSKLGDHPALLRMLNRIGAAIREDAIIVPRPGGSDGVPLAEKMYPNAPL
jgi:hypothetical protein